MLRRIYVEVDARFTLEAQIIPLSLKWADGTSYVINKVINISRSPSATGLCDLKYRCIIEGKERNIFLVYKKYESIVGARWFVEVEKV